MTLVKLVVWGAVLFGAYKAAQLYAIFKTADHIQACVAASGACRLVERQGALREVEVALSGALTCAQERQTRLESMLFLLPTRVPADSLGQARYEELAGLCKGAVGGSQETAR